LTITGEVDYLIHHATMIDVFIEFGMWAFAWINAGKTALVFVNETL